MAYRRGFEYYRFRRHTGGWELLPSRMITPNDEQPSLLKDCLLCGYDEYGNRKQNGKGQGIEDWHHHVANNGGHHRRVRERRHLLPHVALLSVAPGTPCIRAGHRINTTHRCWVCSLAFDGTRRTKFSAMDSSSVADHVTAGPHERRVHDGRFTRFFDRLGAGNGGG